MQNEDKKTTTDGAIAKSDLSSLLYCAKDNFTGFKLEDNGHCMITESGVELFRTVNNGRNIHKFYLGNKDLLKLMTRIRIEDLKSWIKKNDDLPF